MSCSCAIMDKTKKPFILEEEDQLSIKRMELYKAHIYLDCGPESFPTEAGQVCETVTIDAFSHPLSRSVLVVQVKRGTTLHGFQCRSFRL